MEDLLRTGRSSKYLIDEIVAKVKEIVLKNRHIVLRKIAHDFSMSHKSISNILYHQLRRVVAQLVTLKAYKSIRTQR